MSAVLIGWRAAEPLPSPERTWRHALRVILRDPLALGSTFVLAAFVVLALFAYRLAPYPEQGAGHSNPDTPMLTPSRAHPFGTDRLGRDVLSRVLIGAPLGALAGYAGGWLDEVIMRVTDLFLAFPFLLLAMAIATALGRGLDKAAIAL